jgi:cephalosporin hydroxylase
MKEFYEQRAARISSYTDDSNAVKLGRCFNIESCLNGYTYNFSWMGMPIIQYPQDIVMMQEIITSIQPDLIIETGVAHGGSLVFYASMLELLGKGKVVGVDIEIREYNRIEIEKHKMYKRISLVEGSSVDPVTIKQVAKHIDDRSVVMVVLDSKHTHDHVLAELEAYSNFVTLGSYLVVFDTTVETFDAEAVAELAQRYRFKPWGLGSNPRSAVEAFLTKSDDFLIEEAWHRKLLITNCWGGVLRRVK